MGNCIKKGSQSGDEDWVSVGSDQDTTVLEDTDYYYNNGGERKRLIEKNKSGFMISSSDHSFASDSENRHEVRIKVTKKQLEHLMKKADAEGLPLQQILVKLMKMNGGGDLFGENQRSWRPALQSIPE